LALNHDTKGMMDEIGKRIPSMLAFEKMNTIERQSYAEALNMTEESMAEIIKKQEINNRLGTQGAADGAAAYRILKEKGLTHDQIIEKMRAEGAETYATQSITERWSALIERIQDTIGQMAEGPLGKIVNQFIDIVSQTGFFEKVMNKVKGVITSIAGFFADLPGRIQQMLKITKTVLYTVAAIQTAAAIGLAFTNPAAAIAMGLGAAKMTAAAYGAGVAADTVGDMVLTGKQTFNQAAGSNTGNQSNNNQNQQPVAVTVINKVDGQHYSAASNTHNQAHGVGDNTNNNLITPNNISPSGQFA
jgi:hypothetical protein